MSYGKGGGKGLGRGHGRGYNRMGPQGYCICLRCGYKTPKQPGIPCLEMRCPNCGAALVREGSYHHQLYLEKKEKQYITIYNYHKQVFLL